VEKTEQHHFAGDYRIMSGCGNCGISLLQALTNFFLVFNMCTTMARQGCRVPLEHSDMHVAFNMAKISKGGSSCAAIEKIQHLLKKPRAEFREEQKW